MALAYFGLQLDSLTSATMAWILRCILWSRVRVNLENVEEKWQLCGSKEKNSCACKQQSKISE